MNKKEKELFDKWFLYEKNEKSTLRKIVEEFKDIKNKNDIIKLLKLKDENVDRIKRIRGLYNNKRMEVNEKVGNSNKTKAKAKFKFKNFQKFYYWYNSQYHDQYGKCYYCKTKEEDVKTLCCKRSKRSNTRGSHLEVERIDSNNNEYSKKNCVLACYICNNAKSDIFTNKEFKPISDAIANAIKQVNEK